MPAEGVRLTEGGQLLTSEEVLRLARLFVEAGVTKIRLEEWFNSQSSSRYAFLVLGLTDLYIWIFILSICRLTGGEPTVRPDLVRLCQGLSGLSGLETLAMTSNGIKLERQLPELKAAGEDGVCCGVVLGCCFRLFVLWR